MHLPGDGPMQLGGVRLQLLGKAPEAGAAGQAAQLSQQELRMQIGVLPLAARLLQAAKPASQPREDDVRHACENYCAPTLLLGRDSPRPTQSTLCLQWMAREVRMSPQH